MSAATPVEVEGPPVGGAAATRRRAQRVGPVARRRLVVWCPPIFVALLFLPFLLRENAWWEWNNAYWLLERQSAYISAHGLPTIFLNHTSGVFYPMPLYYGGFTFAVLSLPAIVFGSWPTFVAATAAAYVAGYLGIWWTARNLGLSRGLAVLPALAFTCAPYMVATFYGRGAWAEMIGVNSAAAVLGASTCLLWRPERRVRAPLAALVAASALLAGTHNLSLMLSALLLPAIVLLLLPVSPAALRGRALLRRVGWVAVGALVGVGLTAAWLLPNLWFGRQTAIATPAFDQVMLKDYLPYAVPREVLSPWPRLPVGKETFFNYPQTSVLIGAWVLVSALALLWVRRRRLDRMLASIVALIALGIGLVLLVAHPEWWPHFPTTLRAIQMPVRLVPYLGIVIASAATLAILALRAERVRRPLLGILVVLVAAQAAMATWIAVSTDSTSTVRLPAPKHGQVTVDSEPPAFAWPGIMAPVQFLIRGHPTASPTNVKESVGIRLRDGVTSVDGTMVGRGAVGRRIATPVDWSPYVEIVGDAKIVGRDPWGMAVIRVDHVDATGRWRATARPICSGFCLRGDAPWQLPVGRLLTFLSTLLVAGFGLLWSVQALRARRARRTAATG